MRWNAEYGSAIADISVYRGFVHTVIVLSGTELYSV